MTSFSFSKLSHYSLYGNTYGISPSRYTAYHVVLYCCQWHKIPRQERLDTENIIFCKWGSNPFISQMWLSLVNKFKETSWIRPAPSKVKVRSYERWVTHSIILNAVSFNSFLFIEWKVTQRTFKLSRYYCIVTKVYCPSSNSAIKPTFTE